MANEESKEQSPAESVPDTKPPPAAERGITRAGGGGLAAAGAGAGGGHAVVVARPAPVGPALPRVSRRKILLTGFWVAMTGMLASIAATILYSVYPRNVSRLQGKFVIGNVKDLTPGEKREVLVQVPDKRNPLTSLDAKVYLVRLSKEQADRNPGAQEGMVYAFWRKCPHLGCTVPYNPSFSFEDPRTNQSYAGWFRCPCHGSTYSDAGVKVFGPAPRSLDTFPLTIGADGSISIDVSTPVAGAPPFSTDESARGVLPT